MKTQLIMSFENEAELIDFAKKFVNTTGAGVTVTTVEANTGAKKVTVIKEKTVEKTKEDPKQKDIMQEDHHDEDRSESSAKINFESVKDAVLSVSRKKGRDAAVAVLKKFGATKVGPELSEKDYAAVIAECNTVLAA